MLDSRELWRPCFFLKLFFQQVHSPLNAQRNLIVFYIIGVSVPDVQLRLPSPGFTRRRNPRRAYLTATWCSCCFFLEKLRNLPPSPTTATPQWNRRLEFAGDVPQTGTKGDGGRQPSEEHFRQPDVVPVLPHNYVTRTLFFSCRTHTSICWGIGQPDTFETNMLIVYFLFIFSKKKILWDTFFYTRRQSPGAPRRLWRQRACSVFRSTNWVTVSERQKPAAVLPRRRALHLISHLHRKHQMVNSLAISPRRDALASYLNPTCPLGCRSRCEWSRPRMCARFPFQLDSNPRKVFIYSGIKPPPTADQMSHEELCVGAIVQRHWTLPPWHLLFTTPDMGPEFWSCHLALHFEGQQ